MAKRKSRDEVREDLLRHVGAELGPRLSSATIFFHEAVSGKVGLNATDTKVLALLSNSADPVTAGDIARFTRLTTGAVSTVIDRLERAGFADRARDATDRRKVVIRVKEEGLKRLMSHYASLRASVEELVQTYTNADLVVISDFLEKSIAILEREAEKARTTD